MNKLTLRISLTVAGTLALLFVIVSPALASTNYNDLIDDEVFNTTNTMTAAQIDSFLNSFPSSCISTNNGFSAPDVTGYNPTQGFLYGGNTSAGQVIYDAATAYGLNPQVLLATLQKEQSLVTGSSGCSTESYTAALGYGCPDSGGDYSYSGTDLYSLHGSEVTSIGSTCVNTQAKAGFSQQIIHATWLLKFDENRAEGNTGWAVITGPWVNTDDLTSCYSGYMTEGTFVRCPPNGAATFFDGTATIDSTAVTMEDGATAALYDYTPHLSGNNNFDTIFDSWFGSTSTPAFAWQEDGMTILDQNQNTSLATDYMHSGDRLYVELTVTNEGTATWSNSGANPFRLATMYPENGYTPYCDTTWISCDRAATLSEATVVPGGIGHFYFYMAVPNQLGAYRYWFEPVAEWQSWMYNGTGFNIYVNNNNMYDWQMLYYNAYTDSTKTTPVDINNLSRNEQVYVVYYVKNTSPVTWVNSGPNPMRLGTADPQDRMSVLCTNTWITCNRPAVMDQSSVAPGGVATFSFYVKTPATMGTYREYFKPVMEYSGWTPDTGIHLFLNVDQ